MSAVGRGSPADLTPGDEDRHAPDGTTPSWHETWWFDAWQKDGAVAVTCRLTLLPARGRAAYWCQLVRRGEPLLHVSELDAPLPRRGLTVRAAGLWADHVCEAPFEQWTVANEAYAVRLDDPAEAVGRAYGDAAPLAVDLEWYAAGAPRPTAGGGYEQVGEVHGVIELGVGSLTLEAPATRGHYWGPDHPPRAAAPVPPDGLPAPILLPDGTVLEQFATRSGWVRRRPGSGSNPAF